MIRRIVGAVIIGAMLSGCVTATLPCPANQQMSASSNAPDLASIAGGLLTVIAQAGVLGGVAARRADVVPAPAATATPMMGSMTWKTISILGNQNVSCGGTPPAVASK